MLNNELSSSTQSQFNKFSFNKISLNFLSNDIEKQYRKEYFKKSKFAFQISFITVILLYSGFGYIDYLTSKNYLHEFFFIRYFIVFPLLLIVFLFSFHKSFIKIWQWLLSVCYAVGGLGIIYMLLKNPENIYYYGGMFLIFFAGYFFIKLRFIYAVIPGVLLIIAYNIGALLLHELYNIHGVYIIAINAFYISANIICMIALYNIELLERRDYYQKILLSERQKEIIMINKGLENKVKERTKY